MSSCWKPLNHSGRNDEFFIHTVSVLSFHKEKSIAFITFSQQIIGGKLLLVLIWIHNLNYFLAHS